MARLGEIIDGKYEILREIGRGGMSIVYLAMDRRLNKQWAIKEFRKDRDDASKQVALKALLDEANLMKRLDHPTLPRIVDIIDNRQSVYIIMDYIEGESLNKVLDAFGAQPQEAVIEWAKQLSDVLDYLHTQSPPIIYRDMKPANIMLKPDGTVRLIDFGIAREYKEGKDGDTEAIGTRGYAAPEQFGGKGQTDARTDIYSLGVTLYHLVTGKNPAEPPYEIYPIRHWDPTLSSGLEWLIQKCTQLNPNDRYQSCAEVSYVLNHLNEFDTEYRKKKRSRLNWFAASAILAVFFSIVSAGCFMGGTSAKQNSYDELIAAEQYIRAISVDKTNPSAYVSLAEQLYKSKCTVTNDDATGATTITPGEPVTTGDLLDWFKINTMATFKTDYPEEYAKIQFWLGLLLWENYCGTNFDSSMRMAMPYFKEVISVAQSGAAGERAGLDEKKFNMAKVFYSVCYFQVNRNDLLIENAAGESVQLNDTEEYAGIDVDAFAQSPYLSFWNTNKRVLEVLNDEDVALGTKLPALVRISYVLNENYKHFCGANTGDANVSTEEFYKLIQEFETALNSIPDSDLTFSAATENSPAISYSEEKDVLKQEINQVIRSVSALKGVELEEIQ